MKSVTVTETFAVPAGPWGVPLMAPECELMERPAGNPEAVKANGEEPPLTAMAAPYGAPMVPPGSDVFVIVGPPDWVAPLTVRLIVALADWFGCPASATVMVTDAVPTALCAGVPLMVPLEASIERPLGRPVALNV